MPSWVFATIALFGLAVSIYGYDQYHSQKLHYLFMFNVGLWGAITGIAAFTIAKDLL